MLLNEHYKHKHKHTSQTLSSQANSDQEKQSKKIPPTDTTGKDEQTISIAQMSTTSPEKQRVVQEKAATNLKVNATTRKDEQRIAAAPPAFGSQSGGGTCKYPALGQKSPAKGAMLNGVPLPTPKMLKPTTAPDQQKKAMSCQIIKVSDSTKTESASSNKPTAPVAQVAQVNQVPPALAPKSPAKSAKILNPVPSTSKIPNPVPLPSKILKPPTSPAAQPIVQAKAANLKPKEATSGGGTDAAAGAPKAADVPLAPASDPAQFSPAQKLQLAIPTKLPSEPKEPSCPAAKKLKLDIPDRNGTKLKCPECDNSFFNLSRLKKHFENDHIEASQLPSSVEVCAICDIRLVN